MATFQATPALPGYIPEPSTGNKLLRLLSGGAFGKPFGAIERTNLAMAQNRDAENARVDAMLRMKKEEEDRAHAELVQRLVEGGAPPEVATRQAAEIMTMGKQAQLEQQRGARDRSLGASPYQTDIGASTALNEQQALTNTSLEARDKEAALRGRSPSVTSSIATARQQAEKDLADAAGQDANLKARIAALINAYKTSPGEDGVAPYERDVMNQDRVDAAMPETTLAKAASDQAQARANAAKFGNVFRTETALGDLGVPEAQAKVENRKTAVDLLRAGDVAVPHGAAIFNLDDKGQYNPRVLPLLQQRPSILNATPEPAPSVMSFTPTGTPLFKDATKKKSTITPEMWQSMKSEFYGTNPTAP